MSSIEHILLASPYQSCHFSCRLLLWYIFLFVTAQHQPVSSLIFQPNDYPIFHTYLYLSLKMYKRNFSTNFSMNLEFLIFIMVAWHFQSSLVFFLFFILFFIQYWYFDWRFGVVHVIKEPFTTNISQQSLIFSIEVFRSWVFYFCWILLRDFLCYIDRPNNDMQCYCLSIVLIKMSRKNIVTQT